MIILDTNVISEPTRPRPSQTVLDWLNAQDRAMVYTTAISEAEILAGIASMAAGRKRDALVEQTQHTFSEELGGRILPFDSAAAREFGAVVLGRSRKGRPIMEADAQIAAIARVHSATIATRDIEGFDGCGVTIVNPWAAKT